MSESRLLEYEQIIKADGYRVFNEVSGSETIRNRLIETILKGVSLIGGEERASNLRRSGLTALHKHFPVDYLPFLNQYLRENAAEAFRYFCVQFGLEHLFLKHDFYIDDDIAIFIQYPYEVSSRSRLKRHIYMRLNLRNFEGVEEELKKAYAEANQYPPRESDKVKATYHQDLPFVAWVHGPHKDTWFGHSFDGLNLWFAICGVTRKNGLILYPEMLGYNIQHHGASYICPGVSLPKPTKIVLSDGGMVVFNSEILHGTQLNVDQITRVVFASRINPKPPKFYRGTKEAEHSNWHTSSDLVRGRLDNIKLFPREGNYGELEPHSTKTYRHSRHEIMVTASLRSVKEMAICPSEDLVSGQKILVKFLDQQVFIARTKRGLSALSAICPHVGLNLIDGFHDDQYIYCPGHGVTYDLFNGRSECPSLKLKTFPIEERHGMIFIRDKSIASPPNYGKT